jgi:hypothetical protein
MPRRAHSESESDSTDEGEEPADKSEGTSWSSVGRTRGIEERAVGSLDGMAEAFGSLFR